MTSPAPSPHLATTPRRLGRTCEATWMSFDNRKNCRIGPPPHRDVHRTTLPEHDLRCESTVANGPVLPRSSFLLREPGRRPPAPSVVVHQARLAVPRPAAWASWAAREPTARTVTLPGSAGLRGALSCSGGQTASKEQAVITCANVEHRWRRLGRLQIRRKEGGCERSNGNRSFAMRS